MAIDYAALDEDEDTITPKVILPEKKPAHTNPKIPVIFNNDSTECNYLIIAFIIGVLFIINE
tara:strand:+ start:1425 stop:1610 length:186 start_codon:yes stop_codon:yes gene_type:complete